MKSAPHTFRPQSLFGWRRCRHCFLPKSAHPIRCWVLARPLGDTTPADLSWENLNGAEQ